MKGALLTAAAALMGSAMASDLHRRHGHEAFHHRRDLETPASSCGCTTSVITYWGSPTIVPFSAPPTPSPEPTTTSTTTTTLHSTSYATVTVEASSSAPPPPPPSPTSTAPPAPVLPTPSTTVFPSTGTWTIPATTITITSETYVCGATSTTVPSGTHTVGGVTTVVETSTTIVCPYATTSPSGTTVTDVIETTTYICPTPGTYTIAPITTVVPASTTIVWPTPSTITTGTYTQPEQTVVVTETSFTYTCPAATGLPTSSSAPPPAPAQTTTAVPPPVSTTSTSASVAPAPSSTGGSSPGGSSLGQVPDYAITYTGYNADSGSCLDASQVKTDLQKIKSNGFHAVRLYSTDCNQLETVASQAIGLGMNVILGVFISSEGISSGTSQVADIVSWGSSNNWQNIEFIVLDNEAVMDSYCTASELAAFVTAAKATIKAAGYEGAFTISEPLNEWQQYGSTFCEVVDFASSNIQAFFNGGVTAEQAGSFVAEEVALLKKICPKSDVVFVGESGWPTAGDSNGAAIPGASEQKAAMDAIRKECGTFTAQFSYSSDKWKSPGSYGVEQFWGLADMLSS